MATSGWGLSGLWTVGGTLTAVVPVVGQQQTSNVELPRAKRKLPKVVKDNHWLASVNSGPFTHEYRLDLTRLPSVSAIGGEACRMACLAQVSGIWYAALWFYRFQQAMS